MADDEKLLEFARRLRQAAKDVRPQERAADMAGVALPTWQRYIRGNREPGILTVAQFARAIGISLDWLAYGTEAPALDDKLLRQAIEAVEEWLQRENFDLAPEKRALAIEALYSIGVGKPDRQLDSADVRRILRLVA